MIPPDIVESVFGHNNPAVQKRVHEYDKRGVLYALDNPLEIE